MANKEKEWEVRSRRRSCGGLKKGVIRKWEKGVAEKKDEEGGQTGKKERR